MSQERLRQMRAPSDPASSPGLRGHSLFTSESVTEGHPDKMADQIADAVLDAVLREDPGARCAVEVALATGLVLVYGELTCSCYVDIPAIVREVIRDIGYTRAKYGFDAETCAVLTALNEQSLDIAEGVNRAWELRESDQDAVKDELSAIGAGDQGIIFGYACDETDAYLPLPIVLAHELARRLAAVRKDGRLPYLRPDGKTQVTVEYEHGRPVRVDTIVVSSQHGADTPAAQIERDIRREVVEAVVPQKFCDSRTRLFVNPSGRFTVGGPHGDSGVTGRKIVVDTYGGSARHGGGAFSGKDPTKVDRSAAYAARHVAKNLVGAGLAHVCEVQVAYAIGVARPVSLMVDTHGSGSMPDSALARLVEAEFDLRPAAIIRNLDLLRPMYRPLAAYGHFGRSDLDLPWERLDRTDDLRRAADALTGAPDR